MSLPLAGSEGEMSKRQAISHKQNIKTRSRHHFCRGNAVSIVCSECVRP